VITVEDASGAVVPGATLTLVEHQTNDTRTANTNGSGDYTFENLPIGVYTLTIGRSGYSTRVYSAVIVQAGQVTDLKGAAYRRQHHHNGTGYGSDVPRASDHLQ